MRIVDLTNETIEFIKHVTEYAREASPQKIRKDYADFTNPRGKYLERRTKFAAPAFAMEFAVLSFVEENYDSVDDFLSALTDKTVSDLETWLADAPKEGTSMADQVAWLSAAPSNDKRINDLKDKVVDPNKLTEQRKEWDSFVNLSDSKDGLVSGADDLTESERIREGLDTVVETEEMASENEVFAEVDAASLLPMQGVVRPEGDDDGSGGGGGGGGGSNVPRGSELSDAAMTYITENFGSVEFFRTFHKDKMEIDTNGDGVKDMNVIDWIIENEEENPDVIWGLFQRTDWFAENGPSARQFQMDWAKAGGTDEWFPSYDPSEGWLNMTPDMEEMLGNTYDGLVLEASRLGINTDKVENKNAIMQMAYNARQLNMSDYEIKNEFATGFKGAFNIDKVQGSSTFSAIKQKIKQDAAVYMLKLDDTSITDFANKIYLGKTTYEGLNAMHAQKASDDNPALKSLIDQGYTPSAYFSSYSNVASNLLGRSVDFMGGDSKMFSALTDTMTSGDGLGRPMTRGEFERYVRATPEWDTSDNARDEAYSTVDTVLNSFGIRV